MPPEALAEAARSFGYPLFVKPVRAGSSFGVTRLEGPEGLIPAVEEAFRHDREVLLEEAVPGFEVGCAVLGNEELTVGLVDEIELSGGFFNFEEKYTLKPSAIHCPARISQEKAAEIQGGGQGHLPGPGLPGVRPGGPVPHPGGEDRLQRGEHHPRLHLPQPLPPP